MNVLITTNLNSGNSYIDLITEELKKFCNVLVCVNSFWCKEKEFDIVHLQWPEYLTNRDIQFNSSYNKKVIHQLNYWKSKGAKIVFTRHNETPHIRKECDDLYNFIIANSESIIHLGEYSFNQLRNIKTYHKVIFHPIYKKKTKEVDIKDIAREKLGLNTNEIIYLAFGTIRHTKEKKIIIEAFKSLELNNIRLIFTKASEKKVSFYISPFKRIYAELYLFIKKKYLRKFKNIELNNFYLSEEKKSLYFSAVDYIIIPRINTLNSGVLFEGLAHNKIILGPNCGNIKEMLELTNNFIFEPNVNSIKNVMKKVLNIKQKNKEKFSNHLFSVKKIAKQHFEVYKDILDKK